ncbi:hypothetical protein [Kribbella catacumbae]|uniref:hypothetical protein n=1 Tax=Kribbella catacumbae TaxID=460086 RepID=UPI0003712336|nr:hypothetical protein [Kribbella catacumbae]
MSQKDYEAAAGWAEHDMAAARDSESSLRGQEAVVFGRALVESSQGGGRDLAAHKDSGRRD